MIVWTLLSIALAVYVASGLVYVYFLLIAGRTPRTAVRDGQASVPALRFAVILPAHNEELVIGDTTVALRNLRYPDGYCDIHVVADHCSDATAEVARAAGANAHVRDEGQRGRKGFALTWLIDRLLADAKRYDVIAVFDADSRVSPDFLNVVAPFFATGAQVVQGRHVISDSTKNRFHALADADMRLNNRIRNQAKENLGLSARLMGDAMCFEREVLETYPWGGRDSLTEDRDYGINLVAEGVKIRFAPDAVSMGEAASSWRDATNQRMRWYAGASTLRSKYLARLWTRAWRNGDLDALDKILELALPSFSWSAAGALALVLVETLMLFLPGHGIDLPHVLAASLFVLSIAYPFVSLWVTGAPAYSYYAMLSGPFYLAWRIWISISSSLRRGAVAWVRTPRSHV